MHRIHWVRSAAALAALAIVLDGCNGSRGTGTMVPATPPQPPQAGSSGFLYDDAFMRASHFQKPAQIGSFGVDVVVKPQNLRGLSEYAAATRVKNSGLYRRFLTPEEIADRFLATPSDYAAARKYLEKFGLTVSGWKNRYMLRAYGTQRQLERALGTRFGWYQHRDEQFVGPMTAPHVPANVPILGSPDVVYRTKRLEPSLTTAASNGIGNGYSPQQIQLAFDYTGIYNLFYTGTGITLGILGSGPISLQSAHHTGDLESMRALYHASGTNTVSLVAVKGSGLSTPPAVTKPCNQSDNPKLPPSQSPTASCNPEDGVAQVMTEQAALLAPASSVNYYLAYEAKDKDGFSEQGVPLVYPELQQAVNDNTADVLIVGFGVDEQYENSQGQYALDSAQYAIAETQGMSVFAASGDNGAYACQDGLAPPQQNDLCVSYPASDSNVTAVGGVTTPLNSSGQFIGPITAWGETTSGGLGGTGGGLSTLVKPAPDYQANNQNPNEPNAIDPSARNVPDVSLDADPHTGIATVMNADPSIGPRQVKNLGGTTIAAAEMGAMWALILSVCKAKGGGGCPPGPNPTLPYRTGDAAPFFYPIYAEKAFYLYEQTFYDVLFGTTGQCGSATCPPSPSPSGTYLPGQNAGKGYDLATGIGVPFARTLLRSVTGT